MNPAAPGAGRLPSRQQAQTRLRHVRLERYSMALGGALLMVCILFLLVQKLISAPDIAPPPPTTVLDNVHVLKQPPPPKQQLTLPPLPSPSQSEPPPGPPTPSATAAPGLPAPTLSPPAAPVLSNLAAAGVPVDIGSSTNLLGSGKFAGFAGGAGGLGGGGGNGSGRSFRYKPLIPLSTARPEISKWAYEHKIEGWVVVEFTVTTRGTVDNIRIVDAQPKGVFESAAVKSIARWVYSSREHPVVVRQRVEFKLKDYQYNWTTG